jgi:membrane-bound lytic murein transglycosylase D
LSNAVSPVQERRGVWQFMKGAGGEYNLEVNDEIDERYHLEKATRAACASICASKKESLGSWTLAAAAYNGGPGRISSGNGKSNAPNPFTTSTWPPTKPCATLSVSWPSRR